MFSIKQIYRFYNIYNLLFKEHFKKKLKFNWNNYSKRFQIINKIIKKKQYKKYLEIGCFEDENFNKISAEIKVGVDPKSGGNLRMTSDEYFNKFNDHHDLIFIDGLHNFDQVKKDIENSLKALNDNGVILVHDCLPQRIRDQMLPRSHEHWNGDVWKAIVQMRTRKDVDVYTCLADEGIGVIFKRNNKNLLDINVNDFKKLKFRDYYSNYKEYMNIISEDDLLKII